MNNNTTVSAFVSLGKKINLFLDQPDDDLLYRIASNNPWFTASFVEKALKGICEFLSEKSLNEFLSEYSLVEQNKNIGIVMAGNIPAVGFHDLMVVLLSGNNAVVKLSSDDSVLIPFLYELMEDSLKKHIKFVQKLVLNDLDAVIATGSNNTARYFETYFKDIPAIIRKSRTSCAVLSGEETAEDIKALGEDITNYFGKGCRSVTKLFVPEGFSFQFFLDGLSKSYVTISDHTKYRNNYDFYKSIYLVDRVPHLDTGFSLFTKKEGWGAPISVVYYEEYSSKEELKEKMDSQKDMIQCVVGKEHVPFGQAQKPKINDYADGVDTMRFLIEL